MKVKNNLMARLQQDYGLVVGMFNNMKVSCNPRHDMADVRKVAILMRLYMLLFVWRACNLSAKYNMCISLYARL